MQDQCHRKWPSESMFCDNQSDVCDSVTWRVHVTSSTSYTLNAILIRSLTEDTVKMFLFWVTLILLHRVCKCFLILSSIFSIYVGWSYISFFNFFLIVIDCFIFYIFCFNLAALIPITTAQLGGPVNFTCVLPKTETGRRDIHWYHQRAGDTLKIIWTLKESATPKFAPAFDNSRWEANYDKNVSNLTILKTNQDDEGIYHCGFTEWLQDTTWSGTYLLVKGNIVIFFSQQLKLSHVNVKKKNPKQLKCQ